MVVVCSIEWSDPKRVSILYRVGSKSRDTHHKDKKKKKKKKSKEQTQTNFKREIQEHKERRQERERQAVYRPREDLYSLEPRCRSPSPVSLTLIYCDCIKEMDMTSTCRMAHSQAGIPLGSRL